VPRSAGIIDTAQAQSVKGLSFLQISDSHVGFDKPANPNAIGTLEEAIGKIKTLPTRPAFMIHTGDITHLSKPSEFDDADRIISQSRLDVHYVPGEHDFLDEDARLYHDRYGRGTKGAGWHSFDANGVHFIGLVNVVNLRAGGLGISVTINLRGSKQTSRVARRRPRSGYSRTFHFDGLPGLGLGHRGQCPRAQPSKTGSVTVPTATSTRSAKSRATSPSTPRYDCVPQPAPGTAPSPGPMRLPRQAAWLPGITDDVWRPATPGNTDTVADLTLGGQASCARYSSVTSSSLYCFCLLSSRWRPATYRLPLGPQTRQCRSTTSPSSRSG
jgi:hypothetical protein